MEQMKAAVRHQYCGPDGLQLRHWPKPVPQKGEVLIKIRATTVNRTDCGILTGSPWAIRLFAGLIKPSSPITGSDFAGEIVAIGEGVMGYQLGDRVWGMHDNGIPSHAQFMCYSAKHPMAIIPEGITFEQAAASIEGAHYALNFINKVELKLDSRILLNGATGAIGSAALQILVDRGFWVTATCNTRNMECISALKPSALLNYEQEDFTKLTEQFDFVFDAVGKSNFSACQAILKPKGVYISSELGPGAENLYLPLLTKLKGGKRVVFPIPFNIPKSLETMGALLKSGGFKPLIDRTYSLDQVADAFEYVASGQKTGNVLLLPQVGGHK
jgi:NADPH:quinone reductase-like Zn-dependent oxidoreductase